MLWTIDPNVIEQIILVYFGDFMSSSSAEFIPLYINIEIFKTILDINNYFTKKKFTCEEEIT